MKNIGIILDSFCSRTKKEVEKLGFGYLSMQVILDGKNYKDGVDLKFEEAMEKINSSYDKKTSQPNPGEMRDTFERMTKKYRKVIYLCLGSGMSSAFSTATAIAADFDGTVEVWDSSLVGPTYIEMAKWISQEMNENEMRIEEAKFIFNKYVDKLITWVTPERIDAIKSGGRAKKGAALLLSKLKIVPLISYKNSEIEIKGVRRGFAKAVSTVISRIKDTLGDKINEYNFVLMHTNKDSTTQIAINKLKELGINNFKQEITSSAIGIQAGIGSLSIAAYPKKIA
ncbi:DegV family protein [Mycoplasma marinum]|nr:DegV family protein [Mycoplasma marinum]